jgi:hypothetical protein
LTRWTPFAQSGVFEITGGRGVASKQVPLTGAEETYRILHKGCVSGAVVEMALVD